MYRSIILSLALLGGPSLYAKPPHASEKSDKPHKSEKHQKQYKHEKRFSRAEMHTVQSYYDNLPPGLAKKYRRTGELPPGWEKKVTPGNTLPPEYLKIAQPIPRELRETLEAGPVGSAVLRINDRIVRIHEKTHEILDSFMLHKRLN